MTREDWLLSAADALSTDILAPNGATVPAGVRVSIGFPRGSHGRARAIGQCWSPSAVADGRHAVFISPVLTDPVRMLDVLLHELVHASVPVGSGHRKPFSSLAAKCGLIKPWTATSASPELATTLRALSERLGPLDHAGIADASIPRQTTRMLKLQCECGYTVRTTRTWIDYGLPSCPFGHFLYPSV
jgi:hypothetical protein